MYIFHEDYGMGILSGVESRVEGVQCYIFSSTRKIVILKNEDVEPLRLGYTTIDNEIIEGELVEIDGETAHLKLDDGSSKAVEFEALRILNNQ